MFGIIPVNTQCMEKRLKNMLSFDVLCQGKKLIFLTADQSLEMLTILMLVQKVFQSFSTRLS